MPHDQHNDAQQCKIVKHSLSVVNRSCNLAAASTEIVARLGMAHTLVGISHECDFPGSVIQVHDWLPCLKWQGI